MHNKVDHSSGSFVKNLHLWTVCPKDRPTILDLSWKYLTQRHTKGPQFWNFSKYLNLWTTRRRKKGPLFWILISIPLSHVSERKVHDFGCIVEYHGPLSHAPERKVHNFGSFVKYLDLWPSGLPKRSTILDVLLNIWRSKPRPLEKSPKFCILKKKAEPLSHAAYKKVHNFECFVKFLDLWITHHRKVHNFASFVKKGPKFVLEKVQNLKCPPPLEIW